jgi:hypothetical protein
MNNIPPSSPPFNSEVFQHKKNLFPRRKRFEVYLLPSYLPESLLSAGISTVPFWRNKRPISQWYYGRLLGFIGPNPSTCS